MERAMVIRWSRQIPRSGALFIAFAALAGCPANPPLPIALPGQHHGYDAGPPPIIVTVEKDTLTADGLDHARITAHLNRPVEHAVVRFSASAGILSQSAALPDGNDAHVDLIAAREEELGMQDDL